MFAITTTECDTFAQDMHQQATTELNALKKELQDDIGILCQSIVLVVIAVMRHKLPSQGKSA